MEDIKTKIIATIGPATLDKSVFEELVKAGIDYIRINTSYGDYKQYDTILKNVASVSHKKKIDIIFDVKKDDVLDYAVKNNIKIIAMSFAEKTEHIEKVRQIVADAHIISKIESPE